MGRVRVVTTKDNLKWNITITQFDFMTELHKNPYLLWDRIEGSEKTSCKSLEKIGLVDRHANGKMQLTPRGAEILEAYCAKR